MTRTTPGTRLVPRFGPRSSDNWITRGKSFDARRPSQGRVNRLRVVPTGAAHMVPSCAPLCCWSSSAARASRALSTQRRRGADRPQRRATRSLASSAPTSTPWSSTGVLRGSAASDRRRGECLFTDGGAVRRASGPLVRCDRVADIPQSHQLTVALVPFSQIRERGFTAIDDCAPILALVCDSVVDETAAAEPELAPVVVPSVEYVPSDEQFAACVRQVIEQEISRAAVAGRARELDLLLRQQERVVMAVPPWSWIRRPCAKWGNLQRAQHLAPSRRRGVECDRLDPWCIRCREVVGVAGSSGTRYRRAPVRP